MLIPGLTISGITGGALAYVGWRSRKQKTIIELLTTQTPAPAVMEEKPQRVSALYKGLQKQLSETTERAKYILNPDSLLPVSHSTRATLVSQLASPWNDLAVSEIDKKTHSKEKGPLAVEEWQTYGRYLYRYWRPYWRWGLLSVGLGMSFGLYRIVYATALKVLLDGVALSKGGTALAILLKLLIALPITFALMVASELLSARLSSRIVNDVRYDMFEHAQSLSLDYYKRTQRGDLLSRFSADMAILEKAMGASFINSVYITFTLPLYMVALFMLSWQLTLFILFVIPTSTYLLRRHSPNLNEANRTLRQREGAVLSVVQEGISAQPLIQSFGIRQFIQDAYSHELRKLEQTNIDTKFKMRLVRNFSLFSVYFLDVGSMGLGILLVLAGTIPVSTLVAFQVLMSILRREVHYMIELFNELLQAVAAAGRVDQLFQVPIAVRDAVGALELPAFKQAIRFEQVSFSYTDHAYQLQDINLTIEAGQFVAFVGPSGAGKSTIFNLLMRFYDVSGGRVTYDGYDVRDVSQLSLRSQMGVVLQDTFIFNTTILNNIRVIRPEATEADVVAAAKAAELHDFIMSLPDGYQSHAGEAGGQLSGGQKQRIAIARAMLCDPDILLLDEATSSLDADTAAAVNATILDLARSRTVISITHNLSSVVDADKIYVLNQGSLVEQGTHAQLLDQDGLYAQLWQTQSNS